MSQRIYYEVDGKVNGPVTLIQLQLMAAAGTLQPHNRVRKEDSQEWYPARSVKGLFSPSPALPTTVPTAAPRPAPVVAAPPTPASSPFGDCGQSPARAEPDGHSAHDIVNVLAPAPPAPARPPPHP